MCISTNKLLLIVFCSIGILQMQGCFYSYKFVQREIAVDCDPEIDSLGHVFLTIRYMGSNASIFYRAKQKLADSTIVVLAKKYFSIDSIKDSLKMEGVKFKKLGKGSGWTKHVDKDYLFTEDQSIAKIDTVWDVFLDDSTYVGSKIVLSILNNGSTTLALNRGKKPLKAKITVTGSRISVKGDQIMKTEHKKSIFRYLLAKDF